MAKVVTATHCRERFSNLVAAVDGWEHSNSPDLYIFWNGTQCKALTLELEQAFEKFLDDTADEGLQVGPDAKLFILRADQLSVEWDAFKQKVAEESPTCSPSGTDGLWRAYLMIKEAIKQAPTPPKPLPVKQMISDGVSFIQIANIYGWVTEDGQPDTSKVSEEFEAPGTHYDPKTWKSPALKKRQEIVDAEWRNRPHPRSKKYNVIESIATSSYLPPSIDVMVLAGAPAEQISNVHGISMEEAEALLEKAAQVSAGELANV